MPDYRNNRSERSDRSYKSDRPYKTDRRSNDRTSSDHKSYDHKSNDHKSNDHKSYDHKPTGRKPAYSKPYHKPERRNYEEAEERKTSAALKDAEYTADAEYTSNAEYAADEEYASNAAGISAYSQEENTSENNQQDGLQETRIEGRNAVLEAFRAGKTIDKLYVLDGCQDGPVRTIIREAKKGDTILYYVNKERLDQLSETGKHQGVIAVSAAYEYAEVADILQKARDKGEDPFIIICDGIEDPHNLGAIIRTANLSGAHGVIIPKRHAVGLTATVARTSAGALNYTPVAKVTNLNATINELKKEGLWFVCADMGGTQMYDLNLTGPIGLVIGNEGDGVSKLVSENCDMIASIPMHGDIDSLNASVAAGVLAYEIVRQRLQKK